MWICIFVIVAIILICVVFHKVYKIPKCGNMTLVTGGIKTGKSMLSVRLAYKTYRSNLFKVKFLNVIRKLFKKPLLELPLLYSNIPLSVPYVPLTQDLILRNTRFRYKSVCYVCESSLLADSMSFKDSDVNDNLLLLNKLFAHETRGGSIFYDTQSISDNHYAVRRCLSSYFYIHHTIKIPFFCVMFLRELKFSEEGQTVNSFDEDVEETLKIFLVPKRTWKLYDCYCYSAFTDDLPVETNVRKLKPISKRGKKRYDLKAKDLISFRDRFAMKAMKGEKHNEN